MTNPYGVGNERLQEIAQTLLQAKQNTRSAENVVAALIPLVEEDSDTAKDIETVILRSQLNSDSIQLLYNAIAKEAFQEEKEDRRI